MKMEVKILNAPIFKANISKRSKKLKAGLANASEETAKSVKRDAASETPVKTGKLKAGWEIRKIGEEEYEVYNDVEYAQHVEFGTSRMSGKHMLKKAIHRNEAVFKREVREAARKALG